MLDGTKAALRQEGHVSQGRVDLLYIHGPPDGGRAHFVAFYIHGPPDGGRAHFVAFYKHSPPDGGQYTHF